VARDPGPALARRLTAQDFARSAGQALGVEQSGVVASLPPDSKAAGFTNTASALTVTLGHALAYWQLAQQLVAAIPDADAFVARFTDCADFGERCERELVAGLGRELFRRPLEDDELARYRPIFAQVHSDGGGFVEAALYVAEGMLQAPAFLYRLERQRVRAGAEPFVQLTDHEIAARLSYLVWGSAPDAALRSAADAGSLTNAEGRLQQLDRMLADARARVHARGYVGDWLFLSRLDRLEREAGRYPEFSSALAQAMRQETLAAS
jgi:hypothetical protein